jgi:PAS domain-containing protein
MMGVIEMITQTKMGLAGSALTVVGGATALVAEVSSASANPTVTQTALSAIVVGVITAVGSIVVPVLTQLFKLKYDQRVLSLENKVETITQDFKDKEREAAEAKVQASVAAEEARKIAADYHEAKLEAERYRTRFEMLETRAKTNTETLREVKNVVNQTAKAGSVLSPTAAIVTDAYGEILSITGQIEFILHYKPEELIGKRIGTVLPMQLHPDPAHKADRSFHPETEFHDKYFRAIPAVTKEGIILEVDLMLTRWFEKNMRGKVEGVRFGKIIKKHVPGLPDSGVPFPALEEALPGYVKENTETMKTNNELLSSVNGKLGEIVKAGTANAPE